MRAIAVVNQKGGVGKTAVATELGYQLARSGLRTLLVDLDAQASATSIVGVERSADQPTVFDLLGPDTPRRVDVLGAIRPTGEAWAGLACLPAERALAEVETDSSIGREMRLRQVLAQVAQDFDQVVIDCPPALGVLTANGLVAADSALIVSEARVESAQAIGEILATIANVKAYYNPDLRLSGIVINRFLRVRRDQMSWLDRIRKIYQDLVLDVIIPEREAVARAASESVPASSVADICGPFAKLMNVVTASREDS